MLVLDFSRLLPGPLATYILVHLGFDVIRVEDTKGSDMLRFVPPFTDWGESALFSFVNAGKKSIAVDLKTPEGIEIIKRLISKAEVVVEGFRPGVMKRLGLDFESVKKINNKIIYCSISGYGQSGRYSGRPGHDINYVSVSGILKLFETGGRVFIPPVQIADISGALFAVIAILSKLYEKRTREDFSGCHIDISMAETSLFFGIESLSVFLASGKHPIPSQGVLTGGAICYNVYKTKDGRLVSIGSLEQKFWERLVSALELKLEPSDAMTSPDDSNPAYISLREKISSLTSQELDDILSKSDVPYGFVRDYSDIVSDESFRSREVLYSVKERGRTLTLLKLPFMRKVESGSPALGQHTREILKSLGYSDDEIEKLEKKGVIFSAPEKLSLPKK